MRQFKFLLLALLITTSVAFTQSIQVRNTGDAAITFIQDISPFTLNDGVGAYFVKDGQNYVCGYTPSILQQRVFPVFGNDNTTICQDGYLYNQPINYFLLRDAKYYKLEFSLNSESPGYYTTKQYMGIGIIALKSIQITDELQVFSQPECGTIPPNPVSQQCITVALTNTFDYKIYSKPGTLNNSFAIPAEIKNHLKVYWKVIQGNGKLYFADTPKPKYQINSKDRVPGTVLKFLLTVVPKNPNCQEVTEVVTVTLI